jgi:glutamate racemase
MGKIGVIDSGVGGLTVVKEIFKQLPNEEVIYFGDTGRCPYGNKTIDEIKKYTKQMVSFLMEKKVKALVIACNTATALVYEELKNELEIPVIGVIKPGASAAVYHEKTKKVGIIATHRTIESKAYEIEIASIRSDVEIFAQATPLLVPIIEQNRYDEKDEELIEASLFELKQKNLDTLVLGCTHYPLIREKIQKAVGYSVHLVDPALQTVIGLKKTLSQKKLLNEKNNDFLNHEYYVSGDMNGFLHIANSWLRREIHVEYKDISNY